MTDTELFRAMLEERRQEYETYDVKNRLITCMKCTLNGEPFEIEYNEPLDGKPGTIGASRELSFISLGNITAEEAYSAIFGVIDQ